MISAYTLRSCTRAHTYNMYMYLTTICMFANSSFIANHSYGGAKQADLKKATTFYSMVLLTNHMGFDDVNHREGEGFYEQNLNPKEPCLACPSCESVNPKP